MLYLRTVLFFNFFSVSFSQNELKECQRIICHIEIICTKLMWSGGVKYGVGVWKKNKKKTMELSVTVGPLSPSVCWNDRRMDLGNILTKTRQQYWQPQAYSLWPRSSQSPCTRKWHIRYRKNVAGLKLEPLLDFLRCLRSTSYYRKRDTICCQVIISTSLRGDADQMECRPTAGDRILALSIFRVVLSIANVSNRSEVWGCNLDYRGIYWV